MKKGPCTLKMMRSNPRAKFADIRKHAAAEQNNEPPLCFSYGVWGWPEKWRTASAENMLANFRRDGGCTLKNDTF